MSINPSAGSAFGTPFNNGASVSVYRGPERRSGSSLVWRWLALTLDEIDYGMLLVIEDRVVHANHVARSELGHAQGHPLQLVGSELRMRDPRDVTIIRDALVDAARGLRGWLAIGQDAHRINVAVVPLKTGGHEGPPATLLMFGKRQVCEELSVQGFARCHGLTVTETQVLKGLCAGAPPNDIAKCQGVQLSTVRSQIGSIRAKTGAASIRALVRQVAVLPPLVSALRSGATMDAAMVA